ncbi:MAG: TOBE domain-containing protein, partial [Mucispirillum sp.]|nr:TOBE domain-containing protein [Mucispirillum sp.]
TVDVLNKAAVKMSSYASYNTIFEGEIEKYDEESSTALVKFGGGYVESSCEKVEKGRKIRFSVNIHDVVLSIKKPEGISIRNIYKGKVKEIIQQPNNFYDILLDIGDDIWARISKGAYNELAVIENSILFVMIKSAAISDTLRLVH